MRKKLKLQPVQLAKSKLSSVEIMMHTQNALVKQVLFSLHYSGVESANE